MQQQTQVKLAQQELDRTNALVPKGFATVELLDQRRQQLNGAVAAELAANHKVAERYISDAELDANPGLVRTMSVKPPRGSGKVRLIAIGETGEIDLQPCGGTHVKSTAEIGRVVVSKIEKKGRLNRRIRVGLA